MRLTALIEPTKDGRRAECRKCGAAGRALRSNDSAKDRAFTRKQALAALAFACRCPGKPHVHVEDPTPRGLRVWADYAGRPVRCWVEGRTVRTLSGPVLKTVPVVVTCGGHEDVNSAEWFRDKLNGWGYRDVSAARGSAGRPFPAVASASAKA